MMGIDEGPMLLAIEDYRSGLIWNLTNRNPKVKAGLDTIFGPLPYPGDLDHDGEVDGSDLSVFAEGGGSITLEKFATDFGSINCL